MWLMMNCTRFGSHYESLPLTLIPKPQRNKWKPQHLKQVDLRSLPKKQQRVSPFLDEVLTYPKPKSPPSKKKGKSTATIPKHLSSAQAIDYFQQRKDEKEEAEAQKVRNREERERKKKEKEEEKA